MAETPDRIERSIDIATTAERLWELVSEPGWWINDGALRPHRIVPEGHLVLVEDETHGAFRLRVGPHEAPRRAVFAWVPHGGGGSPIGTGATTVEFRIEDRPGGVRLTVVESGFASLDLPEERRRRNHAENTDGWAIELEVARRSAEAT